MANTYTLIEAITVGSGGSASATFSSIPATYTDLCIKWSGRTTESGTESNTFLKFNTSTTGYTGKFVLGNSSAASSGTINAWAGHANAATSTSNTFSNVEIYIPNYASSNNKSYSLDSVQENNATGAGAAYAVLYAALWSNTAAINSIELYTSPGTFVQYSTFYLYGIKNS